MVGRPAQRSDIDTLLNYIMTRCAMVDRRRHMVNVTMAIVGDSTSTTKPVLIRF